MSSFSRFQEKQLKRIEANQEMNTGFVFNAYNTITLTQFKKLAEAEDPVTVTASVVNRQEKDLAYIYTANPTELDIGTVWGAKGLKWLIAEEIVIIKDVNWHKYLAFLCNIELEDAYGFFIGPEKTWVDVVLREKAVLQSKEHPILILPSDTLKLGSKITIGGRAWVVQEKDNVSTAGIDYYYLRETTISKITDSTTGQVTPQEDGSIEDYDAKTPSFVVEPTLVAGVYEIAPNIPITLQTENGYFNSSNSLIQIKSQSSNAVTFIIPFGVSSEITIKTKENNEIITKKFKAVM